MGVGLPFCVLLAACAFGMLHLCAATYALRRFSGDGPRSAGRCAAVTVLKPLCGDEEGLYENLRSFCEQDYAQFQVVFGVRDRSDPAVEVVRKLMADLPAADLALVSDGVSGGVNPKVRTLEKMMRKARHDLLVIADSDIRVRPDYLSRVVQPLADPTIGLVTCLFAARPSDSIWSRLGAMWFNYGFFSSVLFSRLIGVQKGCFGATMALRRETLDRLGGFAAIRDHLADDYALGAAVRRSGQRVVISTCIVDSTVAETSFESLFLHELRWGRTIRSVAPIGYAASVISNPVALSTLGLVLPGYGVPSLVMLGVALSIRLWMTREFARVLELRPPPFWLVFLRDILSLVVFAASFSGTRVVWRKRSLRVGAGGRLVVDDVPPRG